MLWKTGKVNKGSVIEFEVNKLSGNEGFLFYFGLQDLSLRRGYMLNVGGWNNSCSVIETVHDNNSSTLSEKVTDKLDENNWHKVRIVITENGADYYMDGRQVLTHQNEPLKRKFYIAGYDENAGEVIMKVVNASDNPCLTQINLAGGEVEKNGRVITLNAVSKLEENSFEEPFKITPEETTYNKFSTSFKYEFKPNSVTVLRMKKK